MESNQQYYSSRYKHWLFTIAAKNKNHFWAAGGNYLQITSSEIPILESTNAGESWAPSKPKYPKTITLKK